MNNQTILPFKIELSICDWEELYSENHPNIACNKFLKIFFKAYGSAFPKIQIKIKTKTLLNPWITKSIKKYLKNKENLQEKFLKKQTYSSEMTHENYKNLTKKVKSSSKKMYHKNQHLKYENNLKGTWSAFEEIIKKKKVISRFLNNLI